MPITADSGETVKELTPQEEAIRDFRKDMLLQKGYSERGARLIAEKFAIDWHTAAKMKGAGCEENLALYILGATETRDDLPSLN